jgi:hypothetical protein
MYFTTRNVELMGIIWFMVSAHDFAVDHFFHQLGDMSLSSGCHEVVCVLEFELHSAL